MLESLFKIITNNNIGGLVPLLILIFMKNIFLFLFSILICGCVVDNRRGVVIDKIEEYNTSSVGIAPNAGVSHSQVAYISGMAYKVYYSILRDLIDGSINKEQQSLEESYTTVIGDTINYNVYYFMRSKKGRALRSSRNN